MPRRAEGGTFSDLVAWYRAHRRPMPWRLRVEPYACWLSEIMLQQTTYEQALPYYERFLKRFPTVADLARADEQDVLKAWEGLGYYARARNLAKAAKVIAQGGWPRSRAAWLEIPGVGAYTASALASVLLKERTCVVDGNVARVFSRFWHLDGNFKASGPRAALASRLEALLPKGVLPGDFNQAMMELGALVCTPVSPRCGACPLASSCLAHADGDAADYPKNAKRAPLPKRTRTYLVIGDGDGRVLLVQNRKGGLLKGLWDLPSSARARDYVQTFSHFRLEAAVEVVESDVRPEFRDPRTVPLTTAARRILASAGRFASA